MEEIRRRRIMRKMIRGKKETWGLSVVFLDFRSNFFH